MRMELRQSLRLEQKLLQSPQMIQAMQILQLTTPELLDRIQEELEDNPFLQSEAPEEGPAKSEEDVDFDIEGPLLETFRGEGPSSRDNPESIPDGILAVPAPDRRDTFSLMSELRARQTTENEMLAAEAILGQLDSKGFSSMSMKELADVHHLPTELFAATLKMLRQISHPALGAENLQACLLLQLETLPEPHPITEALVRNHYDELLANRLPKIARQMEVSLDELRGALEVLRTLDSRPIEDEFGDIASSIQPDLVFELKDDGSIKVELTRDGMPEVWLSESAKIAFDKAKTDERLHAFLLKKLERARWFLDAINHRRESLKRIAKYLAHTQSTFLERGPTHLAPLKMQEAADAIGVHISTISRTIRGKSALTPQGILPLKSFFSGGQKTDRGGSQSRVSIQERLKSIVEAEDKTAPLSDEEIVRILHERDGIRVARRTIAKYRIGLDIPSSTHRRLY